MANNRITQSPLRPPSHLMMRRFVTYSSNCRDTKVLDFGPIKGQPMTCSIY